MLMNKAKYEGLPPDLKALLDKASGSSLVELAGMAWEKAIVDCRKTANDAGNKTLTVKSEDYDAMRKSSAAVEVEWAQEVKPKGLDGAKILAAACEPDLTPPTSLSHDFEHLRWFDLPASAVTP